MPDLKEQLYQLCGEYLKSREAEIKMAIAEAQEAANNETKSSAGDKYETGREVMQQEIDLNRTRLNELSKLKTILEHIVPAQKSVVVVPGSVVYTSEGNFYIAISAGQLKADNTVFYAISSASPVGSKLMGGKVGDVFALNGKQFLIEKIL